MQTNTTHTTRVTDVLTGRGSYGALGLLALFVAHCAGMVDLVGLPVWVGTLIGNYGFDPQQAGMVVTLFLVGAVCSSMIFSTRLYRLPLRTVATVGFGLAAGAMFAASQTQDLTALAVLHALAGVSAGAGLTVTHGAIGRGANPHKLFAFAGMALGVFAIGFLSSAPALVAKFGGVVLFYLLTAIMAVAAVLSLLFFPRLHASANGYAASQPQKLPAAVWFGILGVSCMALSQSMVFSFVQRIGIDNGFGQAAVMGVLVALGFVNLTPAPLAALLQRRLSARTVVLTGPLLQAGLAMAITHTSTFGVYAFATSVFAAVMIFTHTFAFGLLARLDDTGRAVAATPAMLMTGAAVAPFLGGILVKNLGYGSVGIAVCCVTVCAIFCFSRTPKEQSA